jgi:hypothetical protein
MSCRLGYQTPDRPASGHGRRARPSGGGVALATRGASGCLRLPGLWAATGKRSATSSTRSSIPGSAAWCRVLRWPTPSHRAFDADQSERLRTLMHQSPRLFGQHTSVWTLPLAAGVSFAEGITAHLVSGETVRATLVRPGGAPAARQELDHQPRPGVRPKKSTRGRLMRLALAHPDWVLGFEDEVWWSRLARPALSSWVLADQPPRLIEQTVAKGVLVGRRQVLHRRHPRPPLLLGTRCDSRGGGPRSNDRQAGLAGERTRRAKADPASEIPPGGSSDHPLD